MISRVRVSLVAAKSIDRMAVAKAPAGKVRFNINLVCSFFYLLSLACISVYWQCSNSIFVSFDFRQSPGVQSRSRLLPNFLCSSALSTEKKEKKN